MDRIETQKIAQAWLDFQKNWWAWDKLDELCRTKPDKAWAVLIELVEKAEGKELLEDIGVGPLEDFLNYYATDFIEQIESSVGASEAMSVALSHAQLRDASHPMAGRIAALGARVSSAGPQTDAFDDSA